MKGRLMLASSPPVASVCALSCALVSVCGISSIGKYCVSVALWSLGSNGARMRRSWSQTTPRKKGWRLISAAPPMRPRRSLGSQMRLCIRQHLKDEERRGNIPFDKVFSVP